MIKILKIFFLKNEKNLKNFLKWNIIVYCRLSIKKNFAAYIAQRTAYSPTAHSTKGAPQQAQSLLTLEKTSAHRSQEEKETPKKKENKKQLKNKASTF